MNATISTAYQGVAVSGIVVHREGKKKLVRVTKSADHAVIKPGQLFVVEAS